jgi:hypothetical protein
MDFFYNNNKKGENIIIEKGKINNYPFIFIYFFKIKYLFINFIFQL